MAATAVVDSRYVVIRGLSDRYNVVVLNGARLPSSDPDKRAVNIDIFPNGLIETLISSKTYSPDLPGEATGGYLNIITKRVPKEPFLNWSFSTGYNTQTTGNPDFVTYRGSGPGMLGTSRERALPDYLKATDSTTLPGGPSVVSNSYFDPPASPADTNQATVSGRRAAAANYFRDRPMGVNTEEPPMNFGLSVIGGTEIDVFEVCGEKPNWVKGSLHQWGKTRFSNTGKHKGADTRAGFHTYAVEWERDEIRWYMDDELIHSRGRFVNDKGDPLPACDRAAGEHHTAPYFPRSVDKVNVIAGNGVSEHKGFCKGPKDPKPWPKASSMEVDWIRVYQRVPQTGLTDLCDQARSIRTVKEGKMHRGGSTLISIEGPHGTLDWQVGPGLREVERTPDGIRVKASGSGGSTRVIAYCADDPCTQRPTSFEVQVEAEN